MADGTGIEWTDATWTPIRARGVAGKVGWHCEKVSDGCRNCYAEGINRRLGNGLEYKPGYRDALEIFLDETMLLAPLKWKKPRRIFVCSMTDLFANFVKDEWIDRVFAVMAFCPQHRFQVLTKRAKRMREYFDRCAQADAHGFIAEDVRVALTTLTQTPSRRDACPVLKQVPLGQFCRQIVWPLPDVWLGVSAEDQANADERIPDLLATPAAVRFVSLEPLLGPIDLEHIAVADDGKLDGWTFNALTTGDYYTQRIERIYDPVVWDCGDGPFREHKLDWVIVGGESGPHARPMHPDWARSIRDQCKTAGVPFFFKQWGTWKDGSDFASDAMAVLQDGRVVEPTPDAMHEADRAAPVRNGVMMRRVGKKRAGRLLNGREWNEMPA